MRTRLFIWSYNKDTFKGKVPFSENSCVGSMAEHLSSEQKVVGSSPIRSTSCRILLLLVYESMHRLNAYYDTGETTVKQHVKDVSIFI